PESVPSVARVESRETPRPTGRSLSRTQRHEMVETLLKHRGGTLTINAVLGDAESIRFAQAVQDAFLDAEWHVKGVHEVAYKPARTGLCLSTGNYPWPEEMLAAHLALTAAGFEVSQQLDPTQKR